jgi:tetratricopeptide (TPR) repeat protein
MECPRCGEADVAGPECPACGVILAKARPRPAPSRMIRDDPEPPGSRRPGLVSVVLAAVGVAAGIWAFRRAPPANPLDRPRLASPAGAPAARETRPPITVAPPRLSAPPPPAPEPLRPLESVDEAALADQATADRLGALLQHGLPAGPDDLRAARDLHARYGDLARALLEAILVNTANQEREANNHAEAVRLLRQAAALSPTSPHPQKALVGVWLETGDWVPAEAAARSLLALTPGDVEVTRGLAYSLVRQDRPREALEILSDLLDHADDAEARALLARIEGDVEAETGLTEQRLAHFHVRYDGDEHVAVGREVLRVLDRHYSTLARALDHRPDSPIPVILLSRESYAAATGAPGWSGGLYDSFDGRVRIPIGGLTPSLTPEMDDTLLHELTHAFVADRSRGVAPRVIQEGLAQLMEGKRVEDLLDARELEALAAGRLRGVGGFYMSALSFVEHLEAQRGQGGINDLLDAMAATGNADEAFREVYGKDARGLQAEWSGRLRRQYGH